MGTKWPSSCPVFWSKLRDRMLKRGNKRQRYLAEKYYPTVVVLTGLEGNRVDGACFECVRPDNGDAVFYRTNELKPLTTAAVAMLAIAKAGSR